MLRIVKSSSLPSSQHPSSVSSGWWSTPRSPVISPLQRKWWDRTAARSKWCASTTCGTETTQSTGARGRCMICAASWWKHQGTAGATEAPLQTTRGRESSPSPPRPSGTRTRASTGASSPSQGKTSTPGSDCESPTQVWLTRVNPLFVNTSFPIRFIHPSTL